MIVRPNKNYETRSDQPNTNWYLEEKDNLIVDETTEEGKALAQKIKDYWPYFDYTYKEGFITNVWNTKPKEVLRTEQLTALDGEYKPQFDALASQYNLALISGDTATADSLKAQYVALVGEYNDKKVAIEDA